MQLNKYFLLPIEPFIFGGIAINIYSIFLFIAILLSLIELNQYFKKLIKNYNLDDLIQVYFPLLLGGVIGSKFLPILFNIFLGNFESYHSIILNSGTSFLGGIIFAIPIIFLYKKYIYTEYKEINNFKFYLGYIFSSILALSIGKLGCFAFGCCHGIPANISQAYIIYSLKLYAPINIPLIPIQLYESVMYFLLYLIIKVINKYKINEQYICNLSLILFFIIRFFSEFYRGEEYTQIKYLNLNFYQIAIVLFIAIYITLTLLKKFSYKKKRLFL